jgi:hypothetical protein
MPSPHEIQQAEDLTFKWNRRLIGYSWCLVEGSVKAVQARGWQFTLEEARCAAADWLLKHRRKPTIEEQRSQESVVTLFRKVTDYQEAKAYEAAVYSP